MKIPLRTSAIVNTKKDEKYCFIWSILASLHPCENSHPSSVSIYRQEFDELNLDAFDLSNGFRCSDVHNFEKPNKLSINILELSFYQDKSKWKHISKPIKNGMKNSDKFFDLLIN